MDIKPANVETEDLTMVEEEVPAISNVIDVVILVTEPQTAHN